MQTAFLKGLLTFDDPTMFKPPPDHPLPAEFAAEPDVIRVEDLESDNAVRERHIGQLWNVTATYWHIGLPDTTPISEFSQSLFIEEDIPRKTHSSKDHP